MKKRKKNHPLMNGKHTRSGLKNTFMPLQVKPSLSVEVLKILSLSLLPWYLVCGRGCKSCFCKGRNICKRERDSPHKQPSVYNASSLESLAIYSARSTPYLLQSISGCPSTCATDRRKWPSSVNTSRSRFWLFISVSVNSW